MPSLLLLALLFLPGATVGADAAAADPRIALVDLQRQDRPQDALELLERSIRENPENARLHGYDYLRAHLLWDLGRSDEAIEAFASTLRGAPGLEPYGRYRLALEQERLGRPEVAAGLIATLLGEASPRALVSPAMRLLRRSVAAGGDCRLLTHLQQKPFRSTERRQLGWMKGECARREGDADAAAREWFDLLKSKRGDQVARLAAESLAALREPTNAEEHRRLGLTFHEHREFVLALHHLIRATVEEKGYSRAQHFELHYAVARSHFWLGNYQPAAEAFAALEARAGSAAEKAQVIYQKARCQELEGNWEVAAETFARADAVDPRGRWSEAALIGEMRLRRLLATSPAQVAAIYRKIEASRNRSVAARAALFLGVSEIVEGRDGAEWLERARSWGRIESVEMNYWFGRQAELDGDVAAAIRRYAEAVREQPHHPFGEAAVRRLREHLPAEEVLRAGEQSAISDQFDDLHDAWILLGDDHPLGENVRERLREALRRDARAAPFVDLTPTPTDQWPLWSKTSAAPQRTDLLLLALGRFDDAAGQVIDHFPIADPELAAAGSAMLARTGATRRSLYIAEILAKRIPDRVPPRLLPDSYRRLLYPPRYDDLIHREMERWQIDPYLLAGVIREESRFDETAFSVAAARGLTQFVFPTARRTAERIGIGPLQPVDLERPEIAITLGAAYLHDLHAQAKGFLPEMVAGYNAGEPQAALWRRYCLSDEPEEYLSKVAFRETRGYLRKVLTSYAHYRDIYGAESSARRR